MTRIVAAVAVVALSAGLNACTSENYDSMSCDQLTVEMRKMTDVDASEPYDLDKVRAINHTRTEKGCWDEL